MKTIFALTLGFLSLCAMGSIFDGDNEESRSQIFVEGISYDFNVYKDASKPFIGTFVISPDDAQVAVNKGSKPGVTMRVRMTGMSYKRKIHISFNATNDEGNVSRTKSFVVAGDGLSSIAKGTELDNVQYIIENNTCDNGCTVNFYMRATCDYTCFRSISVRASAHFAINGHIYRNNEDSDNTMPTLLNEWSPEILISSDSVNNPSCFVLDFDDTAISEQLVTTERSNDGSPILVLAGSGNNKRPTQSKTNDWIMVNEQNYRDIKPGKNYLCMSITDEKSSEKTYARIKVGAASTLTASLLLIFALATLLF